MASEYDIGVLEVVGYCLLGFVSVLLSEYSELFIGEEEWIVSVFEEYGQLSLVGVLPEQVLVFFLSDGEVFIHLLDYCLAVYRWKDGHGVLGHLVIELVDDGMELLGEVEGLGGWMAYCCLLWWF